MLLKWWKAELAIGGKLSWPNSVGQLSFPSATLEKKTNGVNIKGKIENGLKNRDPIEWF
jgi:hypothetical protein